jgi:hypothetical protein
MQYGAKIFVITSFKDTCYIEIHPKVEKSKRGTIIIFPIISNPSSYPPPQKKMKKKIILYPQAKPIYFILNKTM